MAGSDGAEAGRGGAGPTRVSVYYATNRAKLNSRSAADIYSGNRGEPRFGQCIVRFDPVPMMDRVAEKLPFYVPTDTHEVESVEQAGASEFWHSLRASVTASTTGTAVVFVHGYNYGFGRTCRMAAELQRSLGTAGVVVMLSWPSNGDVADYVPDVANVEWSVPFLAEVLARLGEEIGRDRIQLLAHSLGSRGSIYALERLRSDLGVQRMLARFVLMAPDFDSQTFAGFLPRLSPLSGSITLYASANDSPLKLSRKVNGHPRLGEAGEFLTVLDGMETIDVTAARRFQVLGHEYFYYHPAVAADLVRLLETGRGAAERPGLRRRSSNGLDYWEIVDDEGQ